MNPSANDPGQVVEAILAIEAMRPQPRFVVHLGCGDNALVSALRRRRCDGLNIGRWNECSLRYLRGWAVRPA